MLFARLRGLMLSVTFLIQTYSETLNIEASNDAHAGIFTTGE